MRRSRCSDAPCSSAASSAREQLGAVMAERRRDRVEPAALDQLLDHPAVARAGCRPAGTARTASVNGPSAARLDDRVDRVRADALDRAEPEPDHLARCPVAGVHREVVRRLVDVGPLDDQPHRARLGDELDELSMLSASHDISPAMNSCG